MKLSTAILRGCKMRPKQCFTGWSTGKDNACVLGAAIYGAYGDLRTFAALDSLFPCVPFGVMNDLAAANDTRVFSREFLAECLRRQGL